MKELLSKMGQSLLIPRSSSALNALLAFVLIKHGILVLITYARNVNYVKCVKM